MNHQFNLTRSCVAATMLVLSMDQAASAATSFSVVYNSAIPFSVEKDPYYNELSGLGGAVWDGISTIFRSDVTTSDSNFELNSSLYGRHYDSDASQPGEWGLLNRANILNGAGNEWVIKHGLAPSVVGNPNYEKVVAGNLIVKPASYLAVTLAPNDTVGDPILFQEATLTMSGFTGVDSDSQIWAATNRDGFLTYIIPTITYSPEQDTDVYTFDFGQVNLTGKALEVRVYGLLGQDQGTFGTSVLSGVVDPLPVPESGTSLFALVAGMVGLARRRRK